MIIIKEQIDLIGQRFGRLVVVKKCDDYHITKSGRKYRQWDCVCDCGNTVVVTETCLKQGNTKSCGCLHKEQIKKYNSYEIVDDYVIMYTSKNEPFYVDLDDFDRVKDICWNKNTQGYLKGWLNGKVVRLNRYIMNAPDNMFVDHIGGRDTIHDNRKRNLRVVTRKENAGNMGKTKRNKSGHKGVCWDKRLKKWRVSIKKDNKSIIIGSYDDYQTACDAYDQAEYDIRGEYSYYYSQIIAKENNIFHKEYE